MELGGICQGLIPPLSSSFFFFFSLFFFSLILFPLHHRSVRQWHFDLHVRVQSQSTDSWQMLILLSSFPLEIKRKLIKSKRVLPVFWSPHSTKTLLCKHQQGCEFSDPKVIQDLSRTRWHLVI